MSMIFYLFNILTIKKNVYLVYIFSITKDDKFSLLWIKFYQPVRLFADDTSLSYSSTNLLQIERKLNSDINILNTWAFFFI
jgi:hypothetical protein